MVSLAANNMEIIYCIILGDTTDGNSNVDFMQSFIKLRDVSITKTYSLYMA
jgi:hypothetical protein